MPSYQSGVPQQSQSATSASQSQSGHRGLPSPSQSGAPSSYSGYFDYMNTSYTTPHLSSYSSSFNGGYSSPLSNNPFGQGAGASHYQTLAAHGQAYGQQQQSSVPKLEETEEDTSDGGVPLGNQYR